MMSAESIQSAALAIVNGYERGDYDLPSTVKKLEHIVTRARADDHPEAAELDYLWGQIEIINAMVLDQGTGTTAKDVNDLRDLMRRFVALSAAQSSDVPVLGDRLPAPSTKESGFDPL